MVAVVVRPTGQLAGASWPHTRDHCRIYNEDCRIYGENAMINETQCIAVISTSNIFAV